MKNMTDTDNERLLFKGLITCTLAAINVIPVAFNLPAMLISLIACFFMWLAEIIKETD